MGQLFFKKYLQDAIRAGTKRTTIRRWDRPMLRVGQRAFCPGLGWLAINAVDVVDLNTLNDSDAQADGFATIAALRQVLLEYYPGHATDGKKWFRVGFRFAQPARKKGRTAKRQSQSLLEPAEEGEPQNAG